MNIQIVCLIIVICYPMLKTAIELGRSLEDDKTTSDAINSFLAFLTICSIFAFLYFKAGIYDFFIQTIKQ